MNDLEMVRKLAAEPTDESVSRTWYRMTKLQKVEQPRRKWVPALAGLAVLSLFAVAVVFLGGSGGPTVTQWPVGAPPKPAVALNEMAEIAAAQPDPGRTKSVVRTRINGWAGNCTVNAGEKEVCRIESQVREHSHDLKDATPTVEWLASLPSDPQALLAKLRSEVPDNKSWSKDHMVWDFMGGLYSKCELALTPAQRAAFLRALALVDGLTARNLIVDGVHLVAIRHVDKESGDEIIFDMGTGKAVGRASVSLSKTLSIVQASNGPSLAPGVIYQATWKQQY